MKEDAVESWRHFIWGLGLLILIVLIADKQAKQAAQIQTLREQVSELQKARTE